MQLESLLIFLTLWKFTRQKRAYDRDIIRPQENSKVKKFKVNVIIPEAYSAMYAAKHNSSLGSALLLIKEAFQDAFNNTPKIKSTGFSIDIELRAITDHPLVKKIGPGMCEEAVTSITSILNDINSENNVEHFILLYPCDITNFYSIFKSNNINVPIITSAINIECSKRVAIFYDNLYFNLMSSFGSALLQTLDAPLNTYVSVIENTIGDGGIKFNYTFNDTIISSITNSQCYNNV